MKLTCKSARVITPVPFGVVSTSTLESTHGTLEYDTEEQVLLCTPKGPGKRILAVPASNLAYLEVGTTEAAKAAPAPQKPPKAASAPPAPAKADIVKFVKDKDGRIVEQK